VISVNHSQRSAEAWTVGGCRARRTSDQWQLVAFRNHVRHNMPEQGMNHIKNIASLEDSRHQKHGGVSEFTGPLPSSAPRYETSPLAKRRNGACRTLG